MPRKQSRPNTSSASAMYMAFPLRWNPASAQKLTYCLSSSSSSSVKMFLARGTPFLVAEAAPGVALTIGVRGGDGGLASSILLSPAALIVDDREVDSGAVSSIPFSMASTSSSDSSGRGRKDSFLIHRSLQECQEWFGCYNPGLARIERKKSLFHRPLRYLFLLVTYPLCEFLIELVTPEAFPLLFHARSPLHQELIVFSSEA